MKFKVADILNLCVVTVLFGPLSAHAQGCTNTCPPLNDLGLPIPSLCENDTPSDFALSKPYSVCHPTTGLPGGNTTFRLQDFAGPGKIIVLANYYVGCNAGRRESGVFAHVAQRYFDEYNGRVVFVTSLKGGANCARWAGIYQSDAAQLYPGSPVTPKEMPLTVNDDDFTLRDDFFTSPFGHPAYVVLDETLTVRNKFIGPCCGFESYWACTAEIARGLDDQLSMAIDNILGEMDLAENNDSQWAPDVDMSETGDVSGMEGISETGDTSHLDGCSIGDWSEWSPCSIKCPEANVRGIQFRYRTVIDNRPPSFATESAGNLTATVRSIGGGNVPCPKPVDIRDCFVADDSCVDRYVGDDRSFSEVCVPEFGESHRVETVATGFNSPRDLDFHPTPGLHLGNYSEGRTFFPDDGEEVWVVNGGNHSVSIVASLGAGEKQTTLTRRDRGYYHYLINVTALSFNSVKNSGRDEDRDSFNYFALCNDNRNTYIDTKEPNYFMGPTLYDTKPGNRNTVNRLGEDCEKDEPCFFLHTDMLHESPACIGIVHDPETVTSFGNVYWAFDSTGDRENGQLVRFDFQQPHGPGSMDHSIASVRRYPGVTLNRGPPGVHAGMVIHPSRRELFIANPGSGDILAIKADSGSYARTAREEYPIFTNRLPSFEYSIWECPDQRVFASGLDTPSGMALSLDGGRLFVAERGTGRIYTYEVSTGAILSTIETGFATIGGLAVSPSSGDLYFVDADTNSLNMVTSVAPCLLDPPYETRMSADFVDALERATEDLNSQMGNGFFSLSRNYECLVDQTVPDSALFDQVHDNTGYASNDTNVQSLAGMDASAALLANRTDCGFDSELNFDQLLLGGYFCHVCLPGDQEDGLNWENGASCDAGGSCRNVQWAGFVCDNEMIVKIDAANDGALVLQTPEGEELNPSDVTLRFGVTYRFTVRADEETIYLHQSSLEEEGKPGSLLFIHGNECACAKMGPLLVTPDPTHGDSIYLRNRQSGQLLRLRVETEARKMSGYSNEEISGGSTYGSALYASILIAFAAQTMYLFVN